MPPSVRIRRATYSPLRDAVVVADQGQRVPDVFIPPPLHPTGAASGNDVRFSTYPLQDIHEEPQTTGSSAVPRSSSASPVRRRGALLRANYAQRASNSRISQHVLNYGSLRALSQAIENRRSHSSHSDSHRASSRSRGSRFAIEGPQAEVLLSSDPEPGLIGSALSLPHSSVEHFHDHDDPDSESDSESEYSDRDDNHHDDIVEHLDVIDPQVATVSTLTNAANSILIPPLSIYSRKPVVILSAPPRDSLLESERGPGTEREYEDSLDRHVDDILKRPSKFKRIMRGVWSFLKTPLGIITAIYGFLVVFWGAAIIFFLIKIINFHNANTQGFWVEVSSQVENGLFTLTGIGLIPPRVLDTYRVVKIWYYKRRTRKLRARAGLPQLMDEDDLPDPAYDPNYVHVLSDEEQRDLHRQQEKFRRNQTWYRPHGTETHRAFPINTALLICLFIDGNSIFQAILCGCMWGMNRFERPAWTTGTLIPASFLCGITSAIFIWRGGQRTKRTKKVEERLRQALSIEVPEDVNVSVFEGGRQDSVRMSVSRKGVASESVSAPTTQSSSENRSSSEKISNPERSQDSPHYDADERMTVPSLERAH